MTLNFDYKFLDGQEVTVHYGEKEIDGIVMSKTITSIDEANDVWSIIYSVQVTNEMKMTNKMFCTEDMLTSK